VRTGPGRPLPVHSGTARPVPAIPSFDSRSGRFRPTLPDIYFKVPPYTMVILKLLLGLAGLGLGHAEPLRVNLKKVESKDRTGYVVPATLLPSVV